MCIHLLSCTKHHTLKGHADDLRVYSVWCYISTCYTHLYRNT